MATLDELKVELAKMDDLRERASWQDFYLPKDFWPRYREVEKEIKRMEAENPACPRCNGTGETGPMLACGPTGSTLIDKAVCWVCRGNKTISAEQAERMELGERVRAERLRQYIAQPNLAAYLGIDRAADSKAESLGIGDARTFDQMGAWLADQEAGKGTED